MSKISLPPLISEKEGIIPKERRSTDLATYGSRCIDATATTWERLSLVSQSLSMIERDLPHRLWRNMPRTVCEVRRQLRERSGVKCTALYSPSIPYLRLHRCRRPQTRSESRHIADPCRHWTRRMGPFGMRYASQEPKYFGQQLDLGYSSWGFRS